MKFVLVLILAGAAWWYYAKPIPAPGQGPNAEAGMRMADEVIQAIDAFQQQRGGYPLSLDDLIPDYLAGAPTLSNGSRFEYQRVGSNYALTFNYTNPLPVHCTYQPGEPWDCHWF